MVGNANQVEFKNSAKFPHVKWKLYVIFLLCLLSVRFYHCGRVIPNSFKYSFNGAIIFCLVAMAWLFGPFP